MRSRIAGGGMGEVWRAHDEVLDRPVAVKMLHSGLSDDPGFLERFRGEARNAARLSHGNIAQVHDYGEDEGVAYLVMELVEGDPLAAIIRARAPLTAAESVELLSQAATALEEAHRKGIIHRDVKPANIVVTSEGVAKLTDFGIARAMGSAGMTRAGEVLGTPQYLPPEAALGREVGPASDIYSLSVVAFEMLSGGWPFTADTAVGLAMAHIQQQPPPLPGGVPAAVAEVVHRGLAKEPADRYQSAAEFGQALKDALARAGEDAVGVDITAAATTVFTRPAADPEPEQQDSEPVPDLPVDASDETSGPLTTVHPTEADGPTTLRPGQNAVVVGSTVLVNITAQDAVGEPLDPLAFELDADGKVLGDSSFVFYNNPVAESGGVRLSNNGVRVDLDELPDECATVVVALADDHPIGEQKLQVSIEVGSAVLELDASPLRTERAVILARIYRRGDLWKVRNVMAGWADGLEPMVRAFGVDVAD